MPSIDLGQIVGPQGPGVASGGTTGQVLTKTGASNYDTGWKTLAAGDVGALDQTQSDARYLKLSGGDMTGMLDMHNHALTGIPDPVSPSDAVNYQFMMDSIIKIVGPVSRVVFISALPTYSDYEFYVKLTKKTVVGEYTVFGIDSKENIPANGIGYTSVAMYFPNGFGFPGAGWSETGYEGPVVNNSFTISLSPQQTVNAYYASFNNWVGGSATFSGNLIVKAL